MLETKPQLHKVKVEYKIKVTKKIINYLDNYSKVSKPGTQIYTTKSMKISNKDQTLAKFYDILKTENFEFESNDINLYLQTLGLILNSNSSPNVSQKALKR